MPTLLSQGGYTGFTEEELKGVQGGAADADALERKVSNDSFMRPKEQDEASKQTTDVFVTALIIFPLALLVVGAAVFGAPAIFTFATDQVRPG